MAIKLVCVHPFHGFERGQEVLDPEEVAAYLNDRAQDFVKVTFTPHDEVRLTAMRSAAKAEVDAEMAKAAANLPKPKEVVVPPSLDEDEHRFKAPPAKGRHGK